MTQSISLQMVDVKGQYAHIREEVEAELANVIQSGAFINGPAVKQFASDLEQYLSVKHVIPCANGTDALQIALMALGLKPGDEVITTAFTFIATAEVISLLGLKPVFVDIDPGTFNIDPAKIEDAIGPKTKCILPVHLYGQPADMEPIMQIAERHGLFVVEDNAQAIGSSYSFSNGTVTKTGGIGHIGCTSFYPSKNLGAFGDGGAIFTNDDALAEQIRMICNHGSKERYYHEVVGVNSRLDAMQAAILGVKLRRLDQYNAARQRAAAAYDAAFEGFEGVITPLVADNVSHVYHQYTLRIEAGRETRDQLRVDLGEKGIPSMIYYPVPLHLQKAFKTEYPKAALPVTEQLTAEVISLPMHTELTDEMIDYIVNGFKACLKS